MAEDTTATRLSRRLGLRDAVGIGIGAMLGAGVFAAPGPAAALAGSGILLALALAGVVAYANATSTARLAAAQPEAGGVYAFGRKRIGATAGFIAGWAFIAGKLSSLIAMALTFGAYALPSQPRAGAGLAVVAMTILNLSGVQRTARAATIGGVAVGLVLAGIGLAQLLSVGNGAASLGNLTPVTGDGGVHGVLGAAAIMFFAFAGYARVATLGEEVKNPATTIPRAVPIALGAVFAVYLIVISGALAAAGPELLAASAAPLEEAARAGLGEGAASAVRAAAAIGVLGVLLSLMAGVARTTFAMAADGELPPALGRVSGRTKVPHIAQTAVGAIVLVGVVLVPTASAIATSSLLILTYYAIAHLSALRLGDGQRRPLLLAPLGLVGCVALAVNLPAAELTTGAAILAAGVGARTLALALRRG